MKQKKELKEEITSTQLKVSKLPHLPLGKTIFPEKLAKVNEILSKTIFISTK